MSLINLFVAARDSIANWRQRQRAFGELMALDERSLADIGIRREEIRAVVEGYYDEPRDARAPAATPTAGYRPRRDCGQSPLVAGGPPRV